VAGQKAIFEAKMDEKILAKAQKLGEEEKL
jgi:hypothetical protein